MIINYFWHKFVKKIRGCAIRDSRIHKISKMESGSHVVNSAMDRHSFCGYDCVILNTDIGSFCSIANNVSIGASRHPMEWVSMSPVFYEGRDSVKAKFSKHSRDRVKRTSIGNDVWIGERAMIKQGIKIGYGAVIGMGSVVTKDIDDYNIIAGCPTKVIRKKFDGKVIEELISLRWWDWDDDHIRIWAHLIDKPEEFILSVKKQ